MTSRVAAPEHEPTTERFPQLVPLSAARYIEALRGQRPHLSPQGQGASDRLIATIEAALECRTELRPADMAFTARSLDGLRDEDRPRLVNQYVLGTGWDGAPIVVMGTEAAEDYAANNAEELAFHCLYVVLQLAGGTMSALKAVGPARRGSRRWPTGRPRGVGMTSSPTTFSSWTWAALVPGGSSPRSLRALVIDHDGPGYSTIRWAVSGSGR